MGAVVPGLPRIALGCMRLSTDPGRDEERGVATVQAAFDAGVTVFDTARAYALDDSELGHNERLLARALRGRAVRILTKGGMRRPGGRWEPDGRARTLREDCEASVEALAGLSLDTYRAAGVRVELTPSERDALEARYGFAAIVRPAAPAPPTGAEVVLVMGLQGAGKSSAAEGFVARGYTRLNRDERGGTMRRLHDELEALLASGSLRVVADNTYTTRAQRQSAIEVARRRGARAVGVWLDVSLPDAQHNVILRMLSEHGRLLEPEEMDGRDPSRLGPLALLRTMRAIEPPGPDEGFASLETVPFVRRPVVGRDRAAMFVMLEAVAGCALSEPDTYVIGWSPGADAAWVRAKEEELGVSVRCCPHPGGPPRCWCRPPLPGLLLAIAEEHGIDLTRSTLVGTKAVHAALARAAGVAYRDASRAT